MTSIQSLSSYSPASTAKQPKKDMGKEDFLKLLVTQLKNQDPTQPLQNEEFVAQMAQLSVLEQLSNLNKTFTTYLQSEQNFSQHAGMLNKKVTWLDTQTSKQQNGVVTGIITKDNQLYFKIGEQEVPTNAITAVELE